ncbi:AraC family transcriptional regulator [Boseongicola sp. H5]|uniref:helix-turn-helix domain-containing protein n=1 Tax=Boseongicola sp. H5 TaxID=2763261 RepID=UPI001D0B4687|nr:AraC family transcriptional regulator [Boseongicola sp. H5]
MPMFPVSAFVAAILIYLALSTALSGGRHLLVTLLTVAAWQSFAVALVVGYGFDPLRAVLPVTATMIPALAWVTFRSAFFTRIEPAAFHVAGPFVTLSCVFFAPATLDVIVPGVFLGYGAAILITLHRSTDMPLARLEAGEMPGNLWRALAWAMIASAVSDVAIAFAILLGRADWAGWIVTVFSSAALLALGVLSSRSSASAGEAEVQSDPLPAAPTPEDLADDAAIVERLNTLLSRDALYLEPDLTIARLARRLHVPEKRLSAAVNRATGENVSRYINGWRIRNACRLLDDGKSVTFAMLESGFNTKSNFNREFKRVAGTSPSAYAKERA